MNTHHHHDHPYPPPGTIIGQSAGLGWEFVYPLPDETSHEAFERDEEPAGYAVTRSGPRPPVEGETPRGLGVTR